jgi:hypothetical protein
VTYLKIAAYVVFALAALNTFLIIDSGDLFLIPGVLWAVLTGLGLLGASQALGYLKDIRDALVPVREACEELDRQDAGERPVRSMAEIEADIERFKTKQ